MKSPKKFFILGIIFLIIFVGLTFLLQKVDVSTPNRICVGETCEAETLLPICEMEGNESIGFSGFNEAVFRAIGVNLPLYELTNFAGLVVLAFAVAYAIFGLVQIFQRKSLKKVDCGLFALGGLFVTIGAIYVLFEKLILNYRPVCIDGSLEASFPSSHTILALCVCFGIVLLNIVFYKEKKATKFINIILAFLAAFTLVGRFLSGAHWATDIISGIILSLALLLIYYGVLVLLSKNSKT